MTDGPREPTFQMLIKDAFYLSGRGPAVLGRIDSGSVRIGDLVQVWDGDDLITTVPVAGIDAAVRTTDPNAQVGIQFRSSDLAEGVIRSGHVLRGL